MALSYWFTKLSYGNDTTCIQSNNLDLIEQALTRIFEQKGCRWILKPPLPQNPLPVIKELHSRPWRIEPYLWVIGLFVGNLGWTIVKTSPSELLGRRARGASRPMLSELAMQTGCNAFHHSVHDRHWGAMLEANASGQTLASGYLDCDDTESMRFYDEPITEDAPHFSLLSVPEEFQAAGRVRVCVSKKEKQRREEELEALFDQGEEQAAKARSEWRELNMGGFERSDEDLGQLLSCSHSYWHEGNLLYKAFAEPQQLEADGVRLLYFQPAGKPNVGEIWEAISNSAQEDVDDIPW